MLALGCQAVFLAVRDSAMAAAAGKKREEGTMARFGIGQAVRRVEDERFLKGAGNYVGDMTLPGQLYGVVVYSTQAHAKIKSVDTGKAQAAPGVAMVLTGADAVADNIGGLMPAAMPEDIGVPVKSYRTTRPVLCADEVRCVGDRVAFVVAETEAAARDAAELIEIDYETLPAVVSLEDALKPGAAAVWADCPSNVSYRVGFGDEAATKAAFDGARHVVSVKLVNNRVSANSMEGRAALGQYNPVGGSYTLYTSTQHPFGIRQTLATRVFSEPMAKFRVIAPDVGGGFGMK